MEIDKLEVGSLVAGVVGAIAACIAAYYAWRAPSQKDLERVEKNTALTTEELNSVRGHLAQVEDHLNTQNRQQMLAALGQNVSMSVEGEGWTDNSITLTFTVKTLGLRLRQVKLLNELNLFRGVFACEALSNDRFTCLIPSETFGKWYADGRPNGSSEIRTVAILAFLEAQEGEINRTFNVQAQSHLRSIGLQSTYYNTVTGEC